MRKWSTSTKITVALVVILLAWVVGRAMMFGRMAHTIAHQATTRSAVEAASKLVEKRKLARVFKDSTDHAKFQAIRTVQVLAADLTVIDLEGHHVSRAEAAAGALVEFLSDLELPVRAAAAEALGRMGKPAARPLIDVALTSPDKDVRTNATKALTAIGAAAVPEMIEAVKGGKPTQKVGCADALGDLQTPRAIPALIGALSVKEPEVRLAARDSLVTIGQAAVQPLIGALGDKSPFTRRHTAEALGELGDRAAAAPLLTTLDDEHRLVRLAATYALGKVKDPVAVLPLIARLTDTDRELREGAAVSLGQLADQRAVPTLVTALEDQVDAVREAAAASLGRLQPTDPAQLARIDAATRSTLDGARLAAVFALGQIGDPRAVNVVGERLALDAAGQPLVERNEKVRRRAATALGNLGSPAAVTFLLDALRDPDWRVNYAAGSALGALGQPAVPALMARLANADPASQQDALETQYVRRALAEMEPPPAAELAAALRSPQPALRVQAALVLGGVGDEASRRLLEAVQAGDADQGVRFAAERALLAIGKAAAAAPPAPELPESALPELPGSTGTAAPTE